MSEMKRRSSGIAKAAQDKASNFVASFVGSSSGAPDDYEGEKELLDVDEKIVTSTGKPREAGTTGSTQGTPKDVFEFETNHTPDTETEDTGKQQQIMKLKSALNTTNDSPKK